MPRKGCGPGPGGSSNSQRRSWRCFDWLLKSKSQELLERIVRYRPATDKTTKEIASEITEGAVLGRSRGSDTQHHLGPAHIFLKRQGHCCCRRSEPQKAEQGEKAEKN